MYPSHTLYAYSFFCSDKPHLAYKEMGRKKNEPFREAK